MSVTLQDGSTTVTPSSISMTVNGVAVTPVVSSASGVTKVSLANPLPPGSSNYVTFSYSTSGGGPFTASWSFVVSTWNVVTLSTNLWTPPGSGSNSGFAMKIFQSPNTNIFNSWQNISRFADMALQGLYGANVADLTDYTNNGAMWWPGVINFAQNSGGTVENNGSFQAADGYQDAVIPGLGVWNPSSIASTAGAMDNDAYEVKTFLEFPAAGPYIMCVNSDDGFRVTVGDQGAPGKSPLYVVSPAAVAGELPAMYNTVDDENGNNFGVTPPATVPMIGRAVLCNPPDATSIGSLLNASDVNGNIAVFLHNGNFQTQARMAKAAGAIAAICCNNAGDVLYPGIRGSADSNPDPAIPCVSTIYAAYQGFTNVMAATPNTPVIVRITAQDCSPLCGKYDGGRGASDTFFTVQVPEAGVYPFRMVWENGGGDADSEWMVIDPDTGIRTLINDPSSPVKAWITRNVHATGALPAAVMMLPVVSGGDVIISWTGEGELWESYSLKGPWFKSTYQANPSTVVPSPLTHGSFFRVRQY